MEAILLAGGRGIRLAQVLPDRPKPMADIAGHPFLTYLLDHLIAQDFQHAILSIGHMADQIQQYFGGSYRTLALTYAHEETPLGTGGAIQNSLHSAREEDVFVLNADTYMQLDYAAMLAQHQATHAMFSICLRQVDDVSRYGAATIDQQGIVRTFGEKSASGPGLINSGIYLLRRTLFRQFHMPQRFSIETDFIAPHLYTLQPRSFLSSGYFIDIGIPADLVRAQQELP